MSKENNSAIRIVIADDEVEFASTLATRLELRGYATEIVNSGEEALDSMYCAHLPQPVHVKHMLEQVLQ